MSFCSETSELSHYHRMKKCIVNFTLKYIFHPNNPTYISVFSEQFAANYPRKHKAISPFELRVQQLFHFANVDLKRVMTDSISVTPSWTYNIPSKTLPSDLTSVSINIKQQPLSEFFQVRFHEIKFHHRRPQLIDIYTDGSKIGDEVAAAAFIKHHSVQVLQANHQFSLRNHKPSC